MRQDEASMYGKLSAAGKKKYGADRDKETAAKGGQYPDTLNMLMHSTYYSSL